MPDEGAHPVSGRVATMRTLMPSIVLMIGVCAGPVPPAGAVSAGNPPAATSQVTRRPALTNAALEEVAAIWRDPIFQRQFIGSYGINAEVEPRVSPEELALLERARPLMAAQWPKAAQMIEAQIKSDSSAMLDFTLGSIYFQQDQMDKALRWYRRAVRKFPSFRRAHRNMGLIQVRSQQYDDAIRSFTRMIELGGGDAYSYGLLAFAFAAKQDFLAAEAAYRNALLLQPENTEWRLGLVRCVLKQHKYEDAVALLDVMIQSYPDKPEFWLLQANAYLGLKQPLKAAVDIECVDRMNKATAENLLLLGDIYVNEDLLDVAGRAICLSMECDPPPPASRVLRGAEQLSTRGAFEPARGVLKRLRAVQKDLDAIAARRLAKLEARIALAQGGERPELAAALEEVLKMDPLDGDALILLAQYYQRRNDPERSGLYYERAEGIADFEVNARTRHDQLLVG